MSSQLASRLYTDLLSNTYTSNTLNTALSSADYSGAFTELCNIYGYAKVLVNSSVSLPVILGSANARAIATNSPSFLRACANSAYATEQLVATTSGATFFSTILLDNTGQKFSHWRDIDANYRRIKQWVNATGSKLKRQVFTSSGTWVCPTSLLAMSIFAVGGGGGGTSNTSGTAPGGGGGEIKCVNVSSGSLPSSDQTVTIGSGGVGNYYFITTHDAEPGTSTSIGSLAIALFGGEGKLTPAIAPGIGGGSTTNGGYQSFTDWENPLNAVFQCVNASQVGGAGGNGSGSSTPGNPGMNGLPGTGGNPAYSSPNTGSTGGRAYGGGGGGASNVVADGGDANANSGGGGGAGRYSTNANGGDGGSGIAVIYWLEG